jgi:hypothetical protein
MSRFKLGRLLMTSVLVLQAAGGFALDWRGNHLLNPAWHPHARFHDAVAFVFLLLTAAAWYLCRDEPLRHPVSGCLAA